MLTRISQRYTLAAFAFVIAAFVTGAGIVASAECLGVFTTVYVAGAAYQQRQLAQQQHQRRRPARRRPRLVEEDAWPQQQAVDWPSATWNG